jgi:SAM-dependent methyltransferase
MVDFGDLRHLQPFSRSFGFERGTPIPRYYTNAFFSRYASNVRGRVLEIGDNHCTREFGADRVTCTDVLNHQPGVPGSTLVGDLTRADTLPAATFDCAIVEQTLNFIFDLPAALHNLHAALKPGGVLLVTVPGTISQLGPSDLRHSWYWGFTGAALQRLLGQVFDPARCTVEVFGNVLSSIALLHGLAAEELEPGELDHRDELYPLLIAARAVR